MLGDDRFEEALPHAEAALAISPHDTRVKRLVLRILAALGSWDEARREMGSAVAFSDSSSILIEWYVRSLPVAARLEYCEEQLAVNPAHTDAKYLKAVTLAALGRNEEAKSFMGMDRLVEITTIEPPASFTSQQHFRTTRILAGN